MKKETPKATPVFKLYKCKVRITEIREGIEIVDAPSDGIAKNPEWLMWAENNGYIEDIALVDTKFEIIDAMRVTTLGQIPMEARDTLPWYHPNHEADDERALGERFASPGMVDNTDAIIEEIERLQASKTSIDADIAKMRALIQTVKK